MTEGQVRTLDKWTLPPLGGVHFVQCPLRPFVQSLSRTMSTKCPKQAKEKNDE